jgi:hypothetical protein
MVSKIAGLAAGLLLLAVVATAGIEGALTGLLNTAAAPSTLAQADIPADYLRLYQDAAATDCPGLDWTLLAGIGKAESDHGRSTAPGVTTGANPAGAGGPMQFLAPTFAAVLARHRLPPGGATPPSRYNPADAIHAAADYLCDQHVLTDPAAAIAAYNHSDRYVVAVLGYAAAYRDTSALRTRWAPETATVADPSGTGGHVTPRTAALYHTLTAAGALPEGATCWDRHLQNPDSDHPRGRACDLSFRPHDPADVTRGWALARWLVAEQAVYGIHYVIWQGLIWSTEHPAWTTYYSPIYDCPNPHNLTGCHFDHIHVSSY